MDSSLINCLLITLRFLNKNISPNLFSFTIPLKSLPTNPMTIQVGTLKAHLAASTNGHHSATTTITTVSSNNNSNNIITTTQPKLELPPTTTIQIHSNQISNSQQQQVCLESMQLSDVDVRTNLLAYYLIDVVFLSLL